MCIVVRQFAEKEMANGDAPRALHEWWIGGGVYVKLTAFLLMVLKIFSSALPERDPIRLSSRSMLRILLLAGSPAAS